MSPKYFKDQICDELYGAVCYLKKAIDCAQAHPAWSKKFRDMAEAEQGHATELYKMFMEMYAESQGKDAFMTQMRDAIIECFSSDMRQIENYKTTYSMMNVGSNQQSIQNRSTATIVPNQVSL